MIETLSPNFNDRPSGAAIDMLVLHYTGMRSCGEALARLCDESAEVSAHYLIDEDGSVHRLVAEGKRAWHAGLAHWRGETNINDRSIGIELVNPGHEFGYRPFPPDQMTSLVALSLDVLERHPIPARNVVGHSDVAPRRKQDPGEHFNWARLAKAGIGLWPDAMAGEPVTGETVPSALEAIGYETEDFLATLMAFQRRYRPEKIDGALDADTAELVAAVHELVVKASI